MIEEQNYLDEDGNPPIVKKMTPEYVRQESQMNAFIAIEK